MELLSFLQPTKKRSEAPRQTDKSIFFIPAILEVDNIILRNVAALKIPYSIIRDFTFLFREIVAWAYKFGMKDRQLKYASMPGILSFEFI